MRTFRNPLFLAAALALASASNAQSPGYAPGTHRYTIDRRITFGAGGMLEEARVHTLVRVAVAAERGDTLRADLTLDSIAVTNASDTSQPLGTKASVSLTRSGRMVQTSDDLHVFEDLVSLIFIVLPATAVQGSTVTDTTASVGMPIEMDGQTVAMPLRTTMTVRAAGDTVMGGVPAWRFEISGNAHASSGAATAGGNTSSRITASATVEGTVYLAKGGYLVQASWRQTSRTDMVTPDSTVFTVTDRTLTEVRRRD